MVHQASIAAFVGGGLRRARLQRFDRLESGPRCQLEVGNVDAHQHLPLPHRYAAIHLPRDDLTRDAKAEVALHSRRNDAGEPA